MSTGAHRGALPILCNVLAKRCGVEVVWGDYPTASTDNQKVYMPDLPLEGEDLDRYALGLIAHEAGHLRHTNFQALETASDQLADKLFRSVFGLLEDPRIESALCREWPGTRGWLNDLTQAALIDGWMGKINADDPPAVQVQRWLLYSHAHHVMGYSCLRQLARQQERLVASMFAPHQWQELQAISSRAASAGTTEDILDCTRSMASILRDPQPSTEPPEQQQGEQGKGDEAGGQSGGADERQPPGGPEAGQTPSQSGNAIADITPEQIQALRDRIGEIAGDPIWGEVTDKGDIARQALETGLGEARAAGRSVVHMPTVVEDRTVASAEDLIARVKSASMATRARLDELVQAETLDRTSRTRSGRRVGRDAYLRLRRGDGRVFVRSDRDPLERIDAAVIELVDVSGSMKKLIERVREASAALCVAFSDVDGVDTAVSAFPCVAPTGRREDKEGVKVIKGFDEGYRQALGRLAGLQAKGSTPMAGAMLHGAEMLLASERQRRICLVITDGEPDCQASVKAVVDQGHLDDIEYLGIGIGVDLSHLFDTFVRLDNLSDLPRVIVDLVRDAILAREEIEA